jgi:thioredoxin-related protein
LSFLKSLLLLCLVAFSLNASEVSWSKSYEEALVSAKKENKLVYVFITSVDCEWCEKFKHTTLREDKIVKRLNREYSSVEVTKGVDRYPKELKAVVAPMHYFLDADGNIVDYSRGYWDKLDFNFILDDVQKRLKKQRKK